VLGKLDVESEGIIRALRLGEAGLDTPSKHERHAVARICCSEQQRGLLSLNKSLCGDEAERSQVLPHHSPAGIII